MKQEATVLTVLTVELYKLVDYLPVLRVNLQL